jgi:hypothetical protein
VICAWHDRKAATRYNGRKRPSIFYWDDLICITMYDQHAADADRSSGARNVSRQALLQILQ